MAEHGVGRRGRNRVDGSSGAGITPGEAARRLALAASTLRIYSVKLSAALSSGAGGSDVGRRGVRVYSEQDLDKLAQAKGLLARGLTYQEVAGELVGESGPRQSKGVDGSRADWQPGSESTGGVDLRSFAVAAGKVLSVAEAWERLAAEREAEVNVLRERVLSLEAEVRMLKRRVRRWPWSSGGDRE